MLSYVQPKNCKDNTVCCVLYRVFLLTLDWHSFFTTPTSAFLHSIIFFLVSDSSAFQGPFLPTCHVSSNSQTQQWPPHINVEINSQSFLNSCLLQLHSFNPHASKPILNQSIPLLPLHSKLATKLEGMLPLVQVQKREKCAPAALTQH